MATNITREQAFSLLQQYINNPNTIKHCLATEAVMAALAKRLNEDPEKWAMAGLLHDIDLERTCADLSQHTVVAATILTQEGVDGDMIEAIKMHNEEPWGRSRALPFHHALAAGETITGLIMATALVYPDKKLASVKAKSIVKRMKEKNFAASVNRDIIRECERIGIPLAEFAEIALKAMQEISATLEL